MSGTFVGTWTGDMDGSARFDHGYPITLGGNAAAHPTAGASTPNTYRSHLNWEPIHLHMIANDFPHFGYRFASTGTYDQLGDPWETHAGAAEVAPERAFIVVYMPYIPEVPQNRYDFMLSLTGSQWMLYPNRDINGDIFSLALEVGIAYAGQTGTPAPENTEETSDDGAGDGTD